MLTDAVTSAAAPRCSRSNRLSFVPMAVGLSQKLNPMDQNHKSEKPVITTVGQPGCVYTVTTHKLLIFPSSLQLYRIYCLRNWPLARVHRR